MKSPLLADFIHVRICKQKCEKLLTLPDTNCKNDDYISFHNNRQTSLMMQLFCQFPFFKTHHFTFFINKITTFIFSALLYMISVNLSNDSKH